MKLYMLTLAGQGDINVKFIEQATWDWMWALEKNRKTPMPVAVAEAYKRQLELDGMDEEDCSPNITPGSAVNDAALQCPSAEYGSEDVANFYSMKEALAFIKAHNVEVIDTFEGCIY